MAKKSFPLTISVKILKQALACPGQIERFKAVFGEEATTGVPITLKNLRKADRAELSYPWLLNEVFAPFLDTAKCPCGIIGCECKVGGLAAVLDVSPELFMKTFRAGKRRAEAKV